MAKDSLKTRFGLQESDELPKLENLDKRCTRTAINNGTPLNTPIEVKRLSIEDLKKANEQPFDGLKSRDGAPVYGLIVCDEYRLGLAGMDCPKTIRQSSEQNAMLEAYRKVAGDALVDVPSRGHKNAYEWADKWNQQFDAHAKDGKAQIKLLGTGKYKVTPRTGGDPIELTWRVFQWC